MVGIEWRVGIKNVCRLKIGSLQQKPGSEIEKLWKSEQLMEVTLCLVCIKLCFSLFPPPQKLTQTAGKENA